MEWKRTGLGERDHRVCGHYTHSQWPTPVPQDKIATVLFAGGENVGGHWQHIQNDSFESGRRYSSSSFSAMERLDFQGMAILEKWEELGNWWSALIFHKNMTLPENSHYWCSCTFFTGGRHCCSMPWKFKYSLRCLYRALNVGLSQRQTSVTRVASTSMIIHVLVNTFPAF